jgi:hypothetical protein
MSFGFSVSDFITVPALCWNVYKKCKQSSGDFMEISTHVGYLHNVVKETQELLSNETLSEVQGGRFRPLLHNIKEDLDDLNQLLIKHENMGTQSARIWDRMRWGLEDMAQLRLRLMRHTAMLEAFNNK